MKIKILALVLLLGGCGDERPYSKAEQQRLDEQWESDQAQRQAEREQYRRDVAKQARLKQEWIARGSPR